MPRYALLVVVLLAACAEPAQQPQEAREQGTLALTAIDTASAVGRGSAVATAVAQGLVQRVQARLQVGGAVGAVDFCSTTALALTDSLVAGAPAGTAVRRTSTRIRNPQNAPDALEQAALAWFDSAYAAGGALPQAFVQVAGRNQVRYYRPLVVQALCTQCHGTPEAMDPAVGRLLAVRYPNDQATGYREGDLRGVIRVSLPR